MTWVATGIRNWKDLGLRRKEAFLKVSKTDKKNEGKIRAKNRGQ